MTPKVTLYLMLAGLVLAAAQPIASPDVAALLDRSLEKHVAILGAEVSDEFVGRLEEQLGGLLDLHRLTDASEDVGAGAFRVYPMGPKNDTNLTQEFQEEGFKLADLIDFLDKKIPDISEKVAAGFLQDYVTFKIRQERKVVWALFEPSRTKKNLPFRSVAFHPTFYQKFAFIGAIGNFDDIKQKMNVASFPIIVGFFPTADPGNPKGMRVSAFKYSGGMSHASLQKFFELAMTEGFQQDYFKGLQFPPEEKQEDKPGKEGYEDSILVQTFDEKELTLMEECEHNICVLAFEQFWKQPSSTFDKTVQTLRNVQKRFSKKALKVILLEGVCHGYLLRQMGMDQQTLPALAAYNAATEDFRALEGPLTTKTVFDFILKMRSGGETPIKLDRKLRLKRRDCAVATAEFGERAAPSPTEAPGSAELRDEEL